MRVCQFRHFGTSQHEISEAEISGSRETIVLQTRGKLSTRPVSLHLRSPSVHHNMQENDALWRMDKQV